MNPDVKPEYIGEREIYETIINPHHGCDGFVTFIAIVELDGKLSNEYWIDCQGKTNPTIGLTYLSKLSKWKPAIKDSKEVRSQIIITVKRSNKYFFGKSSIIIPGQGRHKVHKDLCTNG